MVRFATWLAALNTPTMTIRPASASSMIFGDRQNAKCAHRVLIRSGDVHQVTAPRAC
jgi:hypothetical protein